MARTTNNNGEEEEEEEEAQGTNRPTVVDSTTPTTPLPWKQLLVLSLTRLSEPINFTVIFPFISDFLWDLKTTDDRKKLGLYSGIIESLFALSQTFTILQWARASDRYGRRPILIIGLLGSSLSSILIGTTKWFPMLIVSRMLNGALNGNVAVHKAILGEICDRTNSARAFSLISLTWALGCIIGPLLGGYLSRPAQRYELFSTKHNGTLALGGLWETFPYLLPCLASSCFSWFGVFLTTFVLKETLPSKVAQTEQAEEDVNESSALLGPTNPNRSYTNPPAADAANPAATNKPNEEVSVWQILQIQQIRRQLISSSFLALTGISIEAISVLYFWEPIAIGGLSFPSQISGSIFSLSGIWGVVILLGIFPFLQRRLGTLSLYRMCIAGFVFVPIIMPLANIIARRGLVNKKHAGTHQGEFRSDVEEQSQTYVLTIVGLAFILKTTCAMAYSCNSIMINQAAAFGKMVPLATLNALAQMAFSCMNAFGPYTVSTLYAITLEHHWLAGHLIWLILATIAISGSLFTLGLFDIEKMVNRGELSVDAVNRRS